jgi:hypothetical protein
MFYHKYNKYDGLIVSAFPDFDDDVSWLVGNIKCPVIMWRRTIEAIFGTDPRCITDKFILLIDNMIFEDTGNELWIWSTYVTLVQKYVKLNPVMIIRYGQVPLLMQILKLIKNELIIHDINGYAYKIGGNTLYQWTGHWVKYVNNAARSSNTVGLLLYDKTQKDMIKYHVCDTDDALPTKHRLRDWPCDIKFTYGL